MTSPGDFPDLGPLFARLDAGDRDALGALIDAVYKRLRELAVANLRHESPYHDLDNPDALINEVYLRIRSFSFRDHSHLLHVVAQTMRRVLVDSARRRRGSKRGDIPPTRVIQDADSIATASLSADELLGLNEALERLEELHPRAARVVELVYFGGYTVREIEEITGINPRAVYRDLTFGKVYLREALLGTRSEKKPVTDAEKVIIAPPTVAVTTLNRSSAPSSAGARQAAVIVEIDTSVPPDAFAEALKALANYYRACGGTQLQASQVSPPSDSSPHHVE